MQIVIKIPDRIYYGIENDITVNGSIASQIVLDAVKSGIPLPEGHGELKDADVLRDYFWDNRSKLYTHKDLRIVIDNAPTIIEADKAESEDEE